MLYRIATKKPAEYSVENKEEKMRLKMDINLADLEKNIGSDKLQYILATLDDNLSPDDIQPIDSQSTSSVATPYLRAILRYGFLYNLCIGPCQAAPLNNMNSLR